MRKIDSPVHLLSLALWWGSLTTIGFMVIPLLFQHLPNRQIAGQMAAQLFRSQAYVSWGCCALLLLTQYRLRETRDLNGHHGNETMLIIAGLVFSFLVYFVVAPQIVLRQNLKLWHSLGTAFFAGQWVCASVLLYKQSHKLIKHSDPEPAIHNPARPE